MNLDWLIDWWVRLLNGFCYGGFEWGIFSVIVAAGWIDGDDQVWISRWVRRCGGGGRDFGGRDFRLCTSTGYQVKVVVVVSWS